LRFIPPLNGSPDYRFMPPVLADLQADPDAYAEAGRTAPVRDLDAMGAAADFAGLTRRAIGAFGAFSKDRPDLVDQIGVGSDQLSPFAEQRTAPAQLTAEQANEKYGIDGRLSFSGPVGEGEAAFKHNETQRRTWREDILGRSDLSPLQSIGAGLSGALIDPLGLPLMYAPEVLGLRLSVEGALAGRAAVEAGEAVVRAGRLGNISRGAIAGAVEGGVGGAIYEAPNYGLRRYAGEDDYSLGDSLANIALGALFGGGFGAFGGAMHGRVPKGIAELGEDARLGALATALDDLIEDRPVSVGGAIEAELARAKPSRAALGALDEGVDGPRIAGRDLDEAVAVTTRGTEIPVRYRIVELGDLVTSHTDDLETQCRLSGRAAARSRERAGAQARNYQLEPS
jgi:hypothetical protein